MRYYLLIVDDEKNTREGLKEALDNEERAVYTAVDGRDALDLIQGRAFDLVISDLRMPRMDGMDLLREIKDRSPDTEVILLTGYGTIETAVAAMREGARSFIRKPVNLDELESEVTKVLQQKHLILENEYLKAQLKERFGLDNMVGKSPAMMKVFEKVDLAVNAHLEEGVYRLIIWFSNQT